MKIGMFTSGYQRNPLEDVFKDAKRFGYDYVELWGGRPHAYAPDLKSGDMAELKELIERYEMPVRGFTPEHNGYPYNFMIGSERMRRDAVEYLKLAMDMSKEMGANFMLVSPSHAGYQATGREIRDRLIRTMTELARHAEAIDQTVVLEALTPYESNVCTTANDLLELFELVPSEHLVGMCDIVPPYVQHESIMAFFDKLGPKMYHMHVIDSDGTTDTHVMPGEGQLPLKELLEDLKGSGYQGTMTIELVTAYINEPRFYARRAINNLRALMV
jgi:protein FrlC